MIDHVSLLVHCTGYVRASPSKRNNKLQSAVHSKDWETRDPHEVAHHLSLQHHELQQVSPTGINTCFVPMKLVWSLWRWPSLQRRTYIPRRFRGRGSCDSGLNAQDMKLAMWKWADSMTQGGHQAAGRRRRRGPSQGRIVGAHGRYPCKPRVADQQASQEPLAGCL